MTEGWVALLEWNMDNVWNNWDELNTSKRDGPFPLSQSESEGEQVETQIGIYLLQICNSDHYVNIFDKFTSN